MGCNCKGGKPQVMNFVDSPDHIAYSKEIYERVVVPNTTGQYTDLDKIEIIGAFSTLYPNASTTPTIADAIQQIRIGVELYDNKQQKRFRR
jgi:hypothetical protein